MTPQAVVTNGTVVDNLSPVYDQILQETFTDSDTGNGRTSPRSPLYESLNRPPHVTLFWSQSLDGHLINYADASLAAVSGLEKKLVEAHQAVISNNHYNNNCENGNFGKRVLIDPHPQSEQCEGHQGGSIIYTTQAGNKYSGEHVHLLQEQDGLLPQVLRHLVREHRIKTLLLQPDTTDTLTAYLNSQQADKVVVVLVPEMIGGNGCVGMKRMPMRLVNTHYEFLDGLAVITGKPVFHHVVFNHVD